MASTTKQTTVSASPFEFAPMSRMHWLGASLAAITGAVHLYMYWSQEYLPFLLAGLGFFGAVALLVVGFHRRLLYVVGVPYTLAQIGAWLAFDMPEFYLGVADKLVQVALIAVLVYLYRTDVAEADDVQA